MILELENDENWLRINFVDMLRILEVICDEFWVKPFVVLKMSIENLSMWISILMVIAPRNSSERFWVTYRCRKV